jgi:ABC-type branched-subunit amino acid transport system substrate-binding protein
MRRNVEIGLLLSREGSYSLISEACRSGALAAIAEVNGDPGLDICLVPVERDPKGNIDLYQPLCDEILRKTTARHVVGCVTSWSRKEVIPTLEKAGGTLWYGVPYEGFEASDHVVYTHACPNQHLLPLLNWTLPRYGRRAYLTGSNYIWGWEMNRLARETIVAAGGAVLGERYLPIGSTEVDRMIAEIEVTKPDFILNSLIGPSSYEFIRAYAALRQKDKRFHPAITPILSCNITECELPAIGTAGEGLIAAGPWFRGARGWPAAGRAFGSSHEAACYAAVKELARLLAHRPGSETLSLAELLATPAGRQSAIDPQTHHTTLPVLIAQIENGAFRTLEARENVAGDPYLTRGTGQRPLSPPMLSVVAS